MNELSAEMAGPVLSCRGLGREFASRGRGGAVWAVEDVNLAVQPGETLGLVGESGCGKTTLARMLAGLLPPTRGEALLRGEPLWRGRRPRPGLPRQVQMVFQDPWGSLNPRLPVWSSVTEGLAVEGLPRARRLERAGELLERVGLSAADGRRYPHQFSGGQRQRVALARALALEPSLLILDEPVSALDVSVQAQMLALLDTLRVGMGLTSLFISHDLAVVGHVSDRVAVMYLGQVVEEAPAAELFREPLHPYAQALMEASPRGLGGRREPRLLPGEASGSPLGCVFHERCPRVTSRCWQERPAMREVGAERRVACHLVV